MDVRELIDRVLLTVNGNQAELARRLGRSETTISRWVTGRNGIDYESALRIARMADLPARDVLEAAGLDADLFPAPGAGRIDDADLSARKFVGALRGVPRRFWADVLAASIALAKAYGDAPVDAPEPEPTRSVDAPVSKPRAASVSKLNRRPNRLAKRRDSDLPSVYLRPGLLLAGS